MTTEFSEPQDIPELESLNLLEFGGEQDLVSTAIQHAQNALPEWTPRDSSTEVVLLESLALILGVEALALQSVGEEVTEQIMGLYGVTRHDGFNTEGQICFQVNGAEPLTVIPAGTRVRFEIEETDETVDFLTTEDATIVTAETLFGYAAIEAEDSGIEGNGIPVGTVLELVDTNILVDEVTISQATYGGESEESDESFRSRASAALSRMSNSLVIPDNFTAAMLMDPRVGRAMTLDIYNPTGTPKTPAPGHVTVAVADQFGEPLNAEVLADLQEVINRQALASLQVHLIAPAYTSVNIAVTVKRSLNSTVNEAKAAVISALTEWLSPATWEWASKVDKNQITARVVGLPEIAALESTPVDIALTGDAPLARAGTITVTVSN